MTVIFYANPNMNGHCAQILAQVQKQLKNYTLIDLTKQKYDPVMHANEHYTAGGYEKSTLTKKYQELVEKHETFVFIYPVWWNSMPAVLKGFFDKVFTAKFAFEFVKMPAIPFPVPKGLLKGKKAVIFTTSGALHWQSILFLGNRYKKIIKTDILGYCGIKTKVCSLYGCTKYSDDKIPDIQKLVKQGLNFII